MTNGTGKELDERRDFESAGNDGRSPGGVGGDHQPDALERALSSAEFIRDLERHVARGGETWMILGERPCPLDHGGTDCTERRAARQRSRRGGVARRVRLKLARRARRRRAAALTDDLVGGGAGPDEAAITRELWSRVTWALSELSPEDQRLIRERYGLERPACGTGPNSSSDRCRLSRAMAALRGQLQGG
ncbi:MAG: hypothetical protein IPJ41_18090 [Phycisphaerales bacterium]|nr:hypothetical protein [Phycisphaerales bacterium]